MRDKKEDSKRNKITFMIKIINKNIRWIERQKLKNFVFNERKRKKNGHWEKADLKFVDVIKTRFLF